MVRAFKTKQQQRICDARFRLLLFPCFRLAIDELVFALPPLTFFADLLLRLISTISANSIASLKTSRLRAFLLACSTLQTLLTTPLSGVTNHALRQLHTLAYIASFFSLLATQAVVSTVVFGDMVPLFMTAICFTQHDLAQTALNRRLAPSAHTAVALKCPRKVMSFLALRTIVTSATRKCSYRD